MINKHILRYLFILFVLVIPLNTVFAQANPPSSTNYKLYNYGFGRGGTASSSSTNYSLFGAAGQVDQASSSSTNYLAEGGLEYTAMASAPGAPTFTNPNSWYNKLKLVINRGGNDPADYKYAVRIASGSGEFQYVQSDNTVSTAFPLSAWQTYTQWGSAAGTTLVGLYPGTTYIVQVAAKQGDFFTQSPWGPAAIATTTNPTFTFSLQTTSQSVPPFSVNIGTINPGSVATSTDKITTTVTTNSNNGALIYVQGTNTGLKSTAANNYTIPSSSSDLSVLTEGYGARGTTVTQTSGGPMGLLSPYNGVGNNVGILDTTKRQIADSTQASVTGGQVSFELQAKAKSTTPSATDYADTLTVVATGSF